MLSWFRGLNPRTHWLRPLLRDWRYVPFLAQLVVTRRCNLECGYCTEFDRESEPVPTAVLERRLRHLKELGTLSVELTGGEPMLHPDIYRLIRFGRSLGMRVMMISNAFLMNEQRIRDLGEAGLLELQVSVDGVQPNEVTTKVLSVLRGKLTALAATAPFRVTLSAVVGSAPRAEVLEVIAFARQHGFQPRVLLLHDASGQLRLSEQELETYELAKVAVGGRFREGRDYITDLLQTGAAPFKCRAGCRYLYVDEHGVVHWCSQTMADFAVPLDAYDAAQLRRQFDTPKSCNVRCTLGCVRNNSRLDEWRPQPGAPAGPADG